MPTDQQGQDFAEEARCMLQGPHGAMLAMLLGSEHALEGIERGLRMRAATMQAFEEGGALAAIGTIQKSLQEARREHREKVVHVRQKIVLGARVSGPRFRL